MQREVYLGTVMELVQTVHGDDLGRWRVMREREREREREMRIEGKRVLERDGVRAGKRKRGHAPA